MAEWYLYTSMVAGFILAALLLWANQPKSRAIRRQKRIRKKREKLEEDELDDWYQQDQLEGDEVCEPDVVITREKLQGKGPGYTLDDAGVELAQTEKTSIDVLIGQLTKKEAERSRIT